MPSDHVDRRAVLALGAAATPALAISQAGAQTPATRTEFPEPRLDFAFQADVALGPIQELGAIDGIRRRIVPIVGGTIAGPRLSGIVLPGGADWQGIRPGDFLTRVFAHYWIKADDGQVVSVQNAGIRRADADVMKRMMAGEIVPPTSYYFRTTPSFEVGDGPHRWMNETVFVAVGARVPDRAIIRVYAVT